MKIKEDLVFDKHTCELIEFADLREINNILDTLEHQCDHDANDSEIPFNIRYSSSVTSLTRGGPRMVTRRYSLLFSRDVE